MTHEEITEKANLEYVDNGNYVANNDTYRKQGFIRGYKQAISDHNQDMIDFAKFIGITETYKITELLEQFKNHSHQAN